MGEPKKIGRKTKCTPERIKRVADAIMEGLHFEQACQIGGISTSTMSNWTIRGEAGEEPFVAFLVAIKEAETGYELGRLRNINTPRVTTTEKVQFDPDGEVLGRSVETKTENVPPFAAELARLERRFPERYSRLERRHHEGAVPVAEQGPRDVKITLVSPDGSEAVATRGDDGQSK